MENFALVSLACGVIVRQRRGGLQGLLKNLLLIIGRAVLGVLTLLIGTAGWGAGPRLVTR